MLNLKKSLSILTIAIFGLLMFSSTAFSQGNMMRNCGGGYSNSNVPKEYRLTDTQLNKISNIRAEYNKRILPLRQKINSLRNEIRTYNSGTNFNAAKLKEDYSKINALKDKIFALHIDAKAEINKVFTKEQLTYYRGFASQCTEFGYGMMNGAGMGNMMNGNMRGMMNGRMGSMMNGGGMMNNGMMNKNGGNMMNNNGMMNRNRGNMMNRRGMMKNGMNSGTGIMGQQNSSINNSSNETWKAPSFADNITNPFKNNSDVNRLGENIFSNQCATCHGISGKGNGPASFSLNPKPANLTSSVVQKQSDGAIFWKISNGNSPMPAFKYSLTKQQRWGLVNYIRELGK
jgi:mono/diheme cytochrome c family protein/Spy/CpxP family protein refolding chaperone